MTDGDDDDGKVLQVRLADLAAQRAEIGWRTQAQLTLVGLNVTAAGVVGSVAITGEHRRPLLLLLPYLCTALGLGWLDHARAIAAVAHYLRVVTWPDLRDAVGLRTKEERERLSMRDDYLVGNRTEVTFRYRMSVVGPYLVIFNTPAVAALALTAGALHAPWLVALWVAGAALTSGTLVWWLRISPLDLSETMRGQSAAL